MTANDTVAVSPTQMRQQWMKILAFPLEICIWLLLAAFAYVCWAEGGNYMPMVFLIVSLGFFFTSEDFGSCQQGDDHWWETHKSKIFGLVFTCLLVVGSGFFIVYLNSVDKPTYTNNNGNKILSVAEFTVIDRVADGSTEFYGPGTYVFSFVWPLGIDEVTSYEYDHDQHVTCPLEREDGEVYRFEVHPNVRATRDTVTMIHQVRRHGKVSGFTTIEESVRDHTCKVAESVLAARLAAPEPVPWRFSHAGVMHEQQGLLGVEILGDMTIFLREEIPLDV